MFKKKPPVEYYLEGRDAWRRGFAGVFLRIRSILFSILLSIALLTGPPWWWSKICPNFSSGAFVINPSYYITGVLLYFSVLFVLGIVYLRKRTLRSLFIKYYLHQLTHQVRDKEAELYSHVVPNKKYSKAKLEKQLKVYLNHLSELVKKYFQLLLKKENVEVAVRLASIEKNKIAYKTYARSSGLNPRREKYSEPVPIDEGIPHLFRKEKGAQGVLIYNDISQAAREGKYKLTKTDEKFPNEIKTMMVAPMNALDKDSIDMIGLLYITSKKKNIFNVKDVDSLSFIADMLALSISNIINFINLKSNNQKEK